MFIYLLAVHGLPLGLLSVFVLLVVDIVGWLLCFEHWGYPVLKLSFGKLADFGQDVLIDVLEERLEADFWEESLGSEDGFQDWFKALHLNASLQ